MNSSSSGSGNFLLVPIPEYPLLDCVPNKTVKIVVLGASNVGKTALIVRFLTKRFIGDYEANTGALYSRKVTLDGEEVSLQIQDTPCVALQDDAEGLYCQEQINRSIYWADGYVLVFSITDHNSYRTIQPLYQARQAHPPFWKYTCDTGTVGNKSDLLRARQVPADEGETLAASLGRASSTSTSLHDFYDLWSSLETNCMQCSDSRGVYFEASARENHEGVHAAFLHLCQERVTAFSVFQVIRALGGGNGEKRRGGLPPGQTQITKHAGAEEEVQAGPLLESQVGHNSLMAGLDQKQQTRGRNKSFHGNKKVLSPSLMEG
ncbi:Ras-like protein family member 11A-like [Nibea albiflora]|uniref:Ras-like protein family member 11A-like n=1 Tax=Nibea albiflora TaxID=240163 RepID=A0ACB7EW47_NIBAL|nr:Ras-like protein family member 11A-like [Nibea albiflora]